MCICACVWGVAMQYGYRTEIEAGILSPFLFNIFFSFSFLSCFFLVFFWFFSKQAVKMLENSSRSIQFNVVFYRVVFNRNHTVGIDGYLISQSD